MKFFIFLLVFISTNCFAQKRLTSQSFQTNVRPVLVSILHDFYQMVEHFPEFPKNLGDIVTELESLTPDKESLQKSCPRVVESRCSGSIESIRKKLSSIQDKTLKLIARQNMSSTIHLHAISGLRTINNLQATLEEAKGLFDNSSFMLKASAPYKRDTHLLLKRLDQLNTYVSLAVVEFIPYQYKDDFRHFFFNFVHPIQTQLSKNQNFEFFNRNIKSLNFAFHLLNMNLTKKNKKTPEGMATYLALIHNRWNSLQRYYF